MELCNQDAWKDIALIMMWAYIVMDIVADIVGFIAELFFGSARPVRSLRKSKMKLSRNDFGRESAIIHTY